MSVGRAHVGYVKSQTSQKYYRKLPSYTKKKRKLVREICDVL